jgi:hypothetical protein
MNQAVLVVESILPGAAIVQLCPPFFDPEIGRADFVHGSVADPETVAHSISVKN